MRTQVAIIGAGPAGTTLALLLHRHGIESVVLERQSRDHVLGRIRAGVLEWTSIEILERIGAAERMHAEGHVHETIKLGWGGDRILEIDLADLAGKPMMAYGQNNLQRDLYDRAEEVGLDLRFEVADVEVHDPMSVRPAVTFVEGGTPHRLECDVIAGCDGFHGVSRTAIPPGVITEYERSYPFGWLGILSETPPLPTLVYANHERGFALCSQRTPMLSRYYLQCSLDDSVEDWPDDRFWAELLRRVPRGEAERIVTGPSIEKSIAPLRSYVAEPMQYGNLCLAGDAAHIVPPTGAKGLNLALADVHHLAEAIAARVRGDDGPFGRYSAIALRRVWSSVRFSWWMTTLMHRFPDQTAFDQRAQEEELIHLARSRSARAALAEQYTGLPLDELDEPAATTTSGRRRPVGLDKPYLDVPGTTLFDAEQSRRGYWLNQFCMSLMEPANRERFKADERAYLDGWAMTDEQRQAVLDRDFNRMIELGGNIYFLAKIGGTDGLSFQQIAGSMTGMSEDDYRAMMIAGGRSIAGNRSRAEQLEEPSGAVRDEGR